MLSALFGNVAYDVVKAVVLNAFVNTDPEIHKKTEKAIDAAASDFFKKYGLKFGNESESFLARQENWTTVAMFLRMDTPDLDVRQLNPHGYGKAPSADEEALLFFVDAVKKHLHNDFFLNLLLTQKSQLHASKITNEELGKLKQAVNNLSTSIADIDRESDVGNYNVEAYGGDLPHQTDLDEGRFYVRNIAPNVKLTYMRRGRKVYSEAFLDDGATVYYEIDENAHITITKSPYPIVIPPEYVINKEAIKDSDGNQKLLIHGKWGLEIVWNTYLGNSQYTDFSMTGGAISLDTRNKRSVITPSGIPH